MTYSQFYTEFLHLLYMFCFCTGNKQKQVAADCDIDPQQFCEHLKSKGMGLRTFFKIICGLGVKPQDILDLIKKAIDKRMEELKKK